ncbi:MAG: hypothetical protein IPQ07_42575 [Myxococcales bacterium]|nr:hypothetical protein [Myxococcales bacterium]
MAKNESTAVNDLINLVSTATPRKLAPDEDLMFSEPAKRSTKAVGAPRMTGTLSGAGEVEPLPRGRGAAGTQQNSVTPPVRVTTAPPSRQSTIPPIAPPIPPMPSRSAASSPALTPPLRTTSSPAITPPERSRPSLPPPTRSSAPAHVAPAMGIPVVAPVDLTDQSWFEESRRVDRVTGPRPHAHVEELFGTAEVPRGMTTAQWLGKLALPMGAMIVVGVFVGGYLAFDGQGGHKRSPQVAAPVAAPAAAPLAVTEPAKAEPLPATPSTEPSTAPVAAAEPAPAQVAVTAPATEPAIAAAAAPTVPTGRPVFVEVRLDSNPAGATVMLVDRGKTTFLGTTPISTAVDGARQYDLVFTYKDRPTHLEHLDPRTTSKLSVKLERSTKPATEVAAPVAPKAAPAKAVPAKLETTEPPAAEVAKPKAEKAVVAPKAEKAEKAVVAPVPAKAPAGGEGVLMISSKPPCEIFIDGKATGLMTPQRSLPLPAGAHKVTLVNTAEKIKKTLSIQITADQPTKVIQDLMNK